MKALITIAALLACWGTSAMAFEANIDDITQQYKRGKLVTGSDVRQLMQDSERWCYRETAGACDWTDIYLDVSAKHASFEIGNAWDDIYDIAFLDSGTFKENRYACQVRGNWIDSVRATHRSDGSSVYGRELATLKQSIRDIVGEGGAGDCFDYLYQSADADKQTINLLQRQYVDGVYDASRDVAVTIYFDAAAANALTLSW